MITSMWKALPQTYLPRLINKTGLGELICITLSTFIIFQISNSFLAG